MMVDLFATSEFVEGGVAAAISVISVLLYLRFVDSRLMEGDLPVSSKLTITPNFRIFVAIGIAASSVTSAAILNMGLAGTASELLFALTLFLFVALFVGFMAIQTFLTSTHIHGDTVTTRSPLGQKQINLVSVTSIHINDRFQFELSDADDTIRFCHYVEGKRALIEHIIERAPSNTTWELREFLDRADKKKRSTVRVSLR